MGKLLALRVWCGKQKTSLGGSRPRKTVLLRRLQVSGCLRGLLGAVPLLCLSGVEAALERVLGKEPKACEMAHVDMKARLQLAGLKHFVDLPNLWPPTLAVLCAVGPRGAVGFVCLRSESWLLK